MQTAYAPGRVELLGNHTDYNEGFVLSAAIDRGVTVTGEATGTGLISLVSEELGERLEIAEAAGVARQEAQSWANYPLGVWATFRNAGLPVGGFRASITSDLPLGAGLSSSAALEVATAKLLEKLFGLTLEPLELARLCRRAENEFVGVNCGLLDQVSSVFGRAGHAVFLDCREEKVEPVPFPAGVSLLITQCGVPHQLSGGEYNERREQCFDAARRLGVRTLREVSSAQLLAAPDLPALSRSRALHVVGENERVLAAVAALRGGDVATIGRLMNQSHESSRRNFENSTPELDRLVAIAQSLPYVHGARLTGGGFGGATVTLVEQGQAAAVATELMARYHRETGHTAQSCECRLADGAR
ncbi:MAG TPA: galactokinase [Chthoniobacteraceae bacterium]|nr:galactokinase [Chthoniobacteraceae bacterium]